ncbi:MAG: DegT/DnrJ/EryC1/StrS family aminotransferase [Bdellovibrionales bacterium]|nr:DegT/DnrJ/EryC1/StrS family aminotransferase [Bdellovibrionales bacterium]
MKVPYIDLSLKNSSVKDDILHAISHVLDSGHFILGEEVQDLEAKIARSCGCKHALGVSNGTDALVLVMKALGIGPGDEVITAPNSFLASASSIALAGATPVFSDVGEDMNLDPEELEKAITPRTKAIIAVHLTGRMARMNEIYDIAHSHQLQVIEDSAQSFGASRDGKHPGYYGVAATYSLHPLKVLSACGDGGLITTNDTKLYERLLVARNHGLVTRDRCEFWSWNFRLDTIQAAILLAKLPHFETWLRRRREIGARYFQGLNDIVSCPQVLENEEPAYHLYVIQTERRDELQAFLADKQIESKIHYPIPIHLQPAAKGLGYEKGSFPVTERLADTILSLPIYPELDDAQVDYVISTVRSYFHA